MTDLLYVVRSATEELRYSLRSVAANLPHARVVVVSGAERPEWLAVDWHRVPEPGSKWANLPAALAYGCAHVGPDAVYLNDDIFVMEPVEALVPQHLGPMSEAPGYGDPSPGYRGGLTATARLLRDLGVAEPLWYEPHTPLAFKRDAMLAALRLAPPMPCLHYRSLYGNVAGIGGERIADVKVRGRNDAVPPGPFVSTSDAAFAGRAGQVVRAAFPNPSPYERSNET